MADRYAVIFGIYDNSGTIEPVPNPSFENYEALAEWLITGLDPEINVVVRNSMKEYLNSIENSDIVLIVCLPKAVVDLKLMRIFHSIILSRSDFNIIMETP